jgi:selenide,water dikinase
VLLRDWGRARLENVETILVAPSPYQVYSGMVPGVVAGHYALQEARIDLARVAGRAGVHLRLDRALAVQASERSLLLEKSGKLQYDLLSLDVGSAPDTRVPGSAEHAIAMKPFGASLEKVSKMKAAGRIAMVGAGAAGVEMAMALRQAGSAVTLYSGKPMFSGGLAKRIEAALRSRGVVVKEIPVERIDAGPEVLAGGTRESFDAVLWTAGAAPHDWLRESPLERDDRGFVLVEPSLRSASHAEVFAVGDCATLRDAPHPKSGVYAIRHAPVLAENLRRTLGGEGLVAYRPQERSLVLLSCGAKYAIAARGGWSAEGAWVWRWKDWIDRRFVRSFG